MTIPDPADKPAMNVDEVGVALGISRASAYEAVKSGQIPSIRVGRRWVVPTAAIRRLLQIDPA